MKNTLPSAALALALASGLGCSDHDLITGSSFVRLSLSPDTTKLVAIGESPRLVLTAQDMNGDPVQPRLVRWVSDDSTTVQVHQDGTITALRDGSATIRAYVGSASTAKTTVTVDATIQMNVAITAVSTRPVTPMTDSIALVVYDLNAPSSVRKP